MARPLRILLPGGWYHVMNRGLERREVFVSAADIGRFLALLEEATERFAIEVHAYCLMGNHYHLLLRTPEPNLSDAMRHIDGLYTQRFNRVRGRDGPLFRGRYHSVMVQADRHLICAARYIHLNPVSSGVTGRPEDWPHSSYRAYLALVDPPNWLRTSVILGFFGSIGARALHRGFVEEGVDPSTLSFYRTARRQPVLGAVSYRDEVARVLGDEDGEALADIPQARLLRPRPPLLTIARVTAAAFDVREHDLPILSNRRGGPLSLARGAFIDLAMRVGRYRLREVCAWLGYRCVSSGSTAAARFRKARAGSEEVRSRTRGAIDRLRGVKSSFYVSGTET